MTHDELRELTAGLALETLTDEERRLVEAHLAECAECAADVRSFSGLLEALARAVPQVEPSAALRDRVLAAAAPEHRPAPLRSWLPAAAAVLLLLGGYSLMLRARLTDLAHRAQARDAQSAGVLSARDAIAVELRGQPDAPGAHARATWSRSHGLVFAAADLPALPAGRAYQLWIVTKDAPLSAGLLEDGGNGRYFLVARTPADIPPPVAVAVTVEPSAGVSAPTGPKYLVGTL